MLLAVPKPLVRPIGDGTDPGGEQVGDENCLVEPGGENAIQHRDFEMHLIDADRFEIGLVVETTGGVVVAR